MDGVLRSWAVPKGPSADPIDKRFAALVEDHPIEYGDFEGRIPSGNYGAGYVIVWDRGTWAPRNDFAEGWRKGKLLFDLNGHKLRGRWTLVRIKSKESKSENDWLLIKERDEYVVKDGAAFPDDSVLSGLTLDEMPEPDTRQEHIARDFKRLKISAAPARRAAPQPMLASSGEPFDRAGWLFEFKYDGYRLFADKNAQNVTLLSRNGLSLTDRFPEIAKAVSMLPFDQLLIDGELVVLDRSGRPNFSELQTRVAVTDRASIAVASRHQPATFFAFDLVEALGRNLRELPLLERKQLLVQMLPTVGPVRYSIHIEDQGRATFTTAQQLGLEGIVGKRGASRYQSGRSPDWIKVRTRKSGDFVVVGWTPGRSDAADLGALVLAEYRSGNLTLVGRVGSGLTSSLRKELKPKLIPQPTPSASGGKTIRCIARDLPEGACCFATDYKPSRLRVLMPPGNQEIPGGDTSGEVEPHEGLGDARRFVLALDLGREFFRDLQAPGHLLDAEQGEVRSDAAARLDDAREPQPVEAVIDGVFHAWVRELVRRGQPAQYRQQRQCQVAVRDGGAPRRFTRARATST